MRRQMTYMYMITLSFPTMPHFIALIILTCLCLTPGVTAWTTTSLSLHVKPLMRARRRDWTSQTHGGQRINPSRLFFASNDDNNNNDDDWGTDDDDISQQSFMAPPSEQTEERDLFIPIFALVSLAGLVGTYAYEMIRLYSRGELYLPWG